MLAKVLTINNELRDAILGKSAQALKKKIGESEVIEMTDAPNEKDVRRKAESSDVVHLWINL
jgi:hypothetical protein